MSENSPSSDTKIMLDHLSDDDFQAYLLQDVSRTFALTIPELPNGLKEAVANAYLLCRIVDTIEDEVSLSPAQKEYFCTGFISVTKTGRQAEAFAQELGPLLSSQTIPAEHLLIQQIPRVIAITHGFSRYQIDALANCVETMAKGMPVFQAQNLKMGLSTLADMDTYCYYVAGCVGEMLAKLFCHYSPEIAAHETELLKLSVSFGQGLQMTNILKDIWDDASRDVCWLPQDIFTETGYQLSDLTTTTNDKNFQLGLERLIGIAQGHLQNALNFTLLIPSHETGIRNFCLLALGMAVLTLRKIKQHPDFTNSSQVKITRNSVKATIFTTRLAVRSNTFLSLLFNVSSRPLKTPGWTYSPQSLKAKSAL
ncbi:MAG: phytoene/squalene synthase family protein [Methylicorpusculum sp.]|uniref:phytoene/squalene synthase family protein n=1 Tax=Methylicorpusculum sp. TaxID=2713644 RepID=UPI00271D6654|nr:phytoene/squalene synthase family protein [Methylicorpusculum sp.]MDO8846465.1 phytoene/squalene synthase family protein [Methylicorpusculum sp.]MDO8939435.1 phytoene/squalene synthase family protein [Methylicorpusculum sp.]MDP2200672.1 phytoene/squalene synthase family protein [Methylicorpusculum sp.]